MRGDKWDKSHYSNGLTYGEATIQKALGIVTKYYQPQVGEPIPLIPEESPQIPYPLEALGKLLGEAATAIAEHVQVPEALAGQAVLAAASLCVQPFFDVESPFKKAIPLSLNVLTIAESGDRKSATDDLATAAVQSYERDLWKTYGVSRQAYEDNLEDYLSIAKKDRLAKAKPVEPRKPFLLCDEPTIEGLHKMFKDGLPSLGLFNSEGGQFVGSYSMHRDNVLKTICGLSTMYDGRPIKRVRGGDGESFTLYGKRLSCHLMLQPIVSNTILTNPLLLGQGFLARFLIASPKSLAGTRFYRECNPNADKRLCDYRRCMKDWLRKPMPINEEYELMPVCLALSPEARELWEKAYNAVEQELGPHGGLTDIKAFASRAGESMLRIAGIVQVFEYPESTTIEEKAMKGAVRLVLGYYLKETLRLVTEAKPSDELVQAKKLLDWLKVKAGSSPFKESFVYQNAPPFFRSAGRAKHFLKVLLEHQWLSQKGDLHQLKILG